MLIKNYKQLARTSLRANALKIIDAGIEACLPKNIIKRSISSKDDQLIINKKRYNLKDYKNIYLIGFGKMSGSVAKELAKIIKIRKGIVIDTKPRKIKNIEVIKGTHPLPSKINIKATKKIMGFVNKLRKEDLLLCIVSGGGSALLFYPKENYDEYMKKLNKIIFSGIDIRKLNRWRTEHSNVKGGKLGKLIKPKLINLYFSDVIGDDLKTIASGPTYIKRSENIVILNNKTAVDAMKKRAESLGYKVNVFSRRIKGEAREIGKKLIKRAKIGICIIAAGETTVHVKGKGKGGRNQETCLGALRYIDDNTVMSSTGSDGIDGPTDAAGAIIDKKSLRPDIDKYLKENDSYNFFKKTKDLIFTERTGTNVMDLIVVLKD